MVVILIEGVNEVRFSPDLENAKDILNKLEDFSLFYET